jgi:hypothetical protein
MSAADVGSAVGDFLTPSEDSCAVCLAQAYLNSIFNLSSGTCRPNVPVMLMCAPRTRCAISFEQHQFGLTESVRIVDCFRMCSSAVDGLHNALPLPSDSPQVISPLHHYCISATPFYCTPKLPLFPLLQRRGGASIPAAIPRGFLGRAAATCPPPTILRRLRLRKRHLLGDVSPIGLILPVTTESSVEITSQRLADCESSDHTEARGFPNTLHT